MELYKRLETALILINMAVLAALFVVHIIFLFELGNPSAVLLWTLSARFIILLAELLWIQKISPETPPFRLKAYPYFSIWINIIFAFAASLFGGVPDSHYSVLMIIPIISAAYHLRLWQTVVVIMMTVFLTFLEIWIFFRQKPPIDYGEFFEAATVSLIFVVVGLIVWLLVGYLREEEGKLQQSLRQLHETQARLVAEEKLAAIGQLAGSIAHEIRNPVAMIASSLMMAEKRDGPLRSEMMEIAAREAKRLEGLTGDFLAYARVKAPELRETNIRDLLEYIASLVKARAAEQGIELNVICESNLTFSLDPSQMQQALLNLVLNALEATAPDGKLLLGASTGKSGLTIFVENTGAAIPAEIAGRIFEPFFTTRPHGTGLGLAIVRNYVQSHRGEIILAANEEGRVRFEVRLPEK